MHYKNGREAKIGDTVIGADYNGIPFCGVVVGKNSESEKCNLSVVPFNAYIGMTTQTASELMHSADALSMAQSISTAVARNSASSERPPIGLGDLVRDKVSDFKGIVTGRTELIEGTITFLVQRKCEAGMNATDLENRYIQSNRLELIESAAVKL